MHKCCFSVKNPVLFYFYGPKNRITVVTHVCPRKTEFGYVLLRQKLGLGIGPLDIIEMVLTCILFYRLKKSCFFLSIFCYWPRSTWAENVCPFVTTVINYGANKWTGWRVNGSTIFLISNSGTSNITLSTSKISKQMMPFEKVVFWGSFMEHLLSHAVKCVVFQ